MLDCIFTETPHVAFTKSEIKKLKSLYKGVDTYFGNLENGQFWCQNFNLEIIKREGGVAVFKYDSDSGVRIGYVDGEMTVLEIVKHIQTEFPRWFSHWNPQLA